MDIMDNIMDSPIGKFLRKLPLPIFLSLVLLGLIWLAFNLMSGSGEEPEGQPSPAVVREQAAVEEAAPTATPSPTATSTPTVTFTPTLTPTVTPTATATPTPRGPNWYGDFGAAAEGVGAWWAQHARDGLGDVKNYDMTAPAREYTPNDDITGGYALYDGYPVWESDAAVLWQLPDSFYGWNEDGRFPLVLPTGDYIDTSDVVDVVVVNPDRVGGSVEQDGAQVTYQYPSVPGGVYAPIIGVPPSAVAPGSTTSALPYVRRAGQGSLLALAPRPAAQMDAAAWFGFQVFWPQEWEAAPIAFTTPNATVLLEGAWAGVLYDPASGETAFWLEKGRATLQGSADEQPLEVQGPADGEHLALVTVSAEGRRSEVEQVGADMLASRFGVANALPGVFTVVATVAGPPDPLPEDLNAPEFLRDHFWMLMVDVDGNPRTGLVYNYAHMKGMGTDLTLFLGGGCLMYTPNGDFNECDESAVVTGGVLSPTRVAFSFPLAALEAIAGENFDPAKLAWRVVHDDYTIPGPHRPKDAPPDPNTPKDAFPDP